MQVGDVVNVVDRRDGMVVVKGATITKIEVEMIPRKIDGKLVDVPDTYATLDLGYAVNIACLRIAS